MERNNVNAGQMGRNIVVGGVRNACHWSCLTMDVAPLQTGITLEMNTIYQGIARWVPTWGVVIEITREDSVIINDK